MPRMLEHTFGHAQHHWLLNPGSLSLMSGIRSDLEVRKRGRGSTEEAGWTQKDSFRCPQRLFMACNQDKAGAASCGLSSLPKIAKAKANYHLLQAPSASPFPAFSCCHSYYQCHVLLVQAQFGLKLLFRGPCWVQMQLPSLASLLFCVGWAAVRWSEQSW